MLDRFIVKIHNRWTGASGRSKLAAKNIIWSLCLKFVSILASLLIVPLTIDYIDATQYGIWMTISSVVAWAHFFDLGLANGFRNRFAQAIAKNELKLAKELVSTTYLLLGAIMLNVLAIILLINNFIDWPSIFNISESYRIVLRQVFMVLTAFSCLSMIVNIFAKLLEADQRPALASLIGGIGQLLSLVVIFILVHVSQGSLLKLAIYFSGVPFFTMLIASCILFSFSRYKIYRPSFKDIRLSLTKDIMSLGVKFFVIYLCMILIFQLMNIVISRENGPLAVTEYNIANRYFSVAYMFVVIAITPMWSAFTDAYTREDFAWMASMMRKLEKGIFLGLIVILLMTIASPIAYHIWIGNKVTVTWSLSITTALMIFAQICGNVFMTPINGLGHMRLQFLTYLGFALIAFPLMTFCCKTFGVVGITIIPTIVYFTQAFVSRIQLWKIINRTASGIWKR